MISKRTLFIIAIPIFFTWLILAEINLYYFAFPWMDTWCYFAPGALAERPFHLSLPFTGDFEGSASTWGIHWPGAPLFYSIIFSLIPFSSLLGVNLFLLFWITTAALSGLLSKRMGLPLTVSIFIGVLILFDRIYFSVAHAQRPEFLASIYLLIWIYLATTERFRRIQGLLLTLCSFGLFITHPCTMGFCVAILILSLGMRFLKFKTSWVGYHLTGMILGSVFFAFWFGLQPDALSQFFDHMNENKSGFSWGHTLIRSLQQFYAPLLTGHLLFFSAVIVSIFQILKIFRQLGIASIRSEQNERILLIIGSFFSLVACQQFFHNTFYAAIYWPLAICLGVFGIQQLISTLLRPSLLTRITVLSGASLFFLAHGAMFFSRTEKWFSSGRPNARAELISFYNSLPQSKKLLIPVVLWEAAATENRKGVFLGSLPYSVSEQRQKKYLDYIWSTHPGDTVTVTDSQLAGSDLILAQHRGTATAQFSHMFPGRTKWGYDLRVYTFDSPKSLE